MAKRRKLLSGAFIKEEEEDDDELRMTSPLQTFIWKEYLRQDPKNASWVAPVTCFKHVPFGLNWDKFVSPNMAVELPVPGRKSGTPCRQNWVGTIVGFAGYFALVEWSSLPPLPDDTDSVSKPKSVWVHCCSSVLKPLGYALSENILLKPPRKLKRKINANYLIEAIDKIYQSILFQEPHPLVPTIRFNHMQKIEEEIKKCATRFTLGQVVEALDKDDCSAYRLGRIVVVVGDRVSVQYFGEDDVGNDKGFWYSQHSPHLHPLGWCKAVGAPLRQLGNLDMVYPKNPPNEELCLSEVPPEVKIEEKMIFEIRHPFNVQKITAGYVVKVLKNGYFVAGTDWTRGDELAEIVLHYTSDYILPLGFCFKNKISFEPPKDAFANRKKKGRGNDEENADNFSWGKYVARGNLKSFDPTPIIMKKPPNKFVKGSKLEAVALKFPNKIRPATVTQVAGRLIRLHFDGYDRTDERTYQWISCDSCNIYPAGYAKMVYHSIEGLPEKPKVTDMVNLP